MFKKLSRLLYFILGYKKITIAITLTGLILIGWWIIGQRSKQPALPQLTTIQKETIRSTIATSGLVNGKESAALKFRSSGKIAYINFKVGSTTPTGAVVAGVDTQELAIALQQAQNTYASKQATTQNIYDQLKGHEKDETFAQRDTRMQAETASNNAYDGVKAAQRAFQDAVIISPINGVVTQVNFLAGQNVSAADIVIQIVDLSEVYFEAEVDEADIGKITVGQVAKVTLNAYPDETFSGKVAQILPLAKTTSSGATIVVVKIRLEQTGINIYPNLNGQAEIVTAEKTAALTVPLEAVTENDEIFIKRDSGLEKIKVSLSIKSDSKSEVTSEQIKEGDQVVTNPAEVQLSRNNNNRLLNSLTQIFRRGR